MRSSMSGRHTRGTFSIVAADPASGEVGCAVQSRYFSVGSVVPWVRAGVGAVATQAAGVAVYGERALAELERGAAPDEALRRVLADDAARETRQLGVVTADGRPAAFTGAECLDWAGHRTADGVAVQGNILAGEAVVVEMERAFAEATGPLALRLVAALEAGQAAGGDRRGQQSAAVVVERVGARDESREGIDRVCDLRVEDHAAPIEELRRLVGIWMTWEALRRADRFSQAKDFAAAVQTMRAAVARSDAEDPLLLYNLACYEALAGERDDALEHVRRAIALEPSYRAVAAGDSDLESIKADLSGLADPEPGTNI
jgi:uncharacterized Ntn-hydrolase superfamily protein